MFNVFNGAAANALLGAPSNACADGTRSAGRHPNAIGQPRF
jgi:hypothetical protein